ncbi:MAG: hypothetical protein L0L39_05100 [Atopostipes suicloacalis]|nr:hypothetical protein [Atopostipes suicloacalis]
MSKITNRFLQEAEKKKLQFSSKVVERNLKDKDGNEVPHEQLILQTALRVDEEKVVPCSLFIHDTDEMDYVNYQITYNRIGLVTDRNKLSDILEGINEFNLMKTGYYHFAISPDGELQMRNLGILGDDPIPTINTFMHGGRILRALMPELEKIEGLDLSNNLN